MSAKKSFLNVDAVKDELTKFGVENLDEEIEIIDNQLKKIISGYKKKTTLAMQQYKTGTPFFDVYKTTDDLDLPDWLLNQIKDARLIGNSFETVILPDGEKYQLNNTLNHLSGREWNNFTASVFSTFYPTNGKESYAHEIRKIHPTPKPPQLMKEIIEFFTKKDALVFDYFMGVGGSLLGASLANRKAVGIDLCQKYIDAYKAASEKLGLSVCQTYCGDCLEVLADKTLMEKLLKNQQINLVLIDPPYGEMMSKEKTGADIEVYGTVATPFTDDKRDFGNVSRSEFLEKLKLSVELVLSYVKKRGYVVVFIKDLQPCKKETNLLHSEIIYKLNEINNLNYKGLKIWADRSTKLFPYGYPFSFVANQIHQYIMIFRKEK